jgi:hypothetical protein
VHTQALLPSGSASTVNDGACESSMPGPPAAAAAVIRSAAASGGKPQIAMPALARGLVLAGVLERKPGTRLAGSKTESQILLPGLPVEQG